jgi:hypothetical protein
MVAIAAARACEDEYPTCVARARAGECWGGPANLSGLALAALVDCRASCQAALAGREEPALVAELGGAGEMVVDRFGVRLEVCGLARPVRRAVLQHRLVAERARAWVPAITETGFKVEEIPGRVAGMLGIARAQGEWREEPCESHVPFNCQVAVEGPEECRMEHSGLQHLLPVSDYMTGGRLGETVLAALLPLGEAWAGLRLRPSAMYGIRRYRRGAWLAGHVDQMASHVVSAILNLGQEGPGAAWPLHILDHSGRPHTVTLEPGQMLWYESARLLHGRPTPLEKESYDNVFVHFRPRDRRWYGMEVMMLRWEEGEVPRKRVELVTDDQGNRTFKVERIKLK